MEKMESTFLCLKKKNVGLKLRMKRSDEARRRMAAIRSEESPVKRRDRLKQQRLYMTCVRSQEAVGESILVTVKGRTKLIVVDRRCN